MKAAVLCGVRVTLASLAVLVSQPVLAEDVLCDTAAENCRARLIQLIRDERIGIDVAFWFMEDARYTAELIKKHDEGVAVRVIVDTRGNATNPLNTDRLEELRAAGIPMRRRTDSNILHWKMMLFDGQNTVQFSAANYSAVAFAPTVPYVDYTDEVIYFTDQPSVVNSFRTKYDDLWTSTSKYGNYANITAPLERRYDRYIKDPELNFPSNESYRNRIVPLYDAETVGIDVTMYRITDRAHSDALIRAVGRGVPVRLYTEPQQYRDPTRYLHSWNVDRLYKAGVAIRHRAHAGLNHQKSVVLRGQQLTIWGSSNWTSVSTDSQEEHNYFTAKPQFFSFFSQQFERKWTNATGFDETEPFTPLPPDRPVSIAPADLSASQPTASVTLTWHAGFWAHVYDIYFGTTPDPPLYRRAVTLGPSTSETDYRRFAITGLLPGTTYYWRIVSRTMADLSASGPVRSFTTDGNPPPPEVSGTAGPGDVVLYAGRAQVAGQWRVETDGTAAGGLRAGTTDVGAAKVSTAFAAPVDYIDLNFPAEAGRPYRLWIRGRAERNSWANDSVHVQFSQSADAAGTPRWRIGTTDSTQVSIEDATGAGVSGWGWQDNGYGAGVLGPPVYFSEPGTQTIRLQTREDGLWIDQIVLSPETFVESAPGAVRNDTTILPESGADTPPPPLPTPDDPHEVVLYAADAVVTGTGWNRTPDASAAGGAMLSNPDAGATKLSTALASPPGYFELTFYAEANTGYRLWIRGRAQNDSWANDSVFVQFSDSRSVAGDPVFRIGTTDATAINLEDCTGCGVRRWGWQDDMHGTVEGAEPPLVYFMTTGSHTLRIQAREDGMSIDQIVLSASKYRDIAPGALKNDATILAATGQVESEEPPPPPPPPPPASEADVVVHASSASVVGMEWALEADPSAAGGMVVRNPDAGRAKVAAALALPESYIELAFSAKAGVPYRLWIRGRAEGNSWANDSVHVQFSSAVTAGGEAVFRIGTAASTEVNLEECSGCGLADWGWQDNGYGAGTLGPVIYFAGDGPQTIRIQTREDGLSIDQVVLSPSTYLNSAPGASKGDTTLLPPAGS